MTPVQEIGKTPAFPSALALPENFGLTKREYIAIQVLQGLWIKEGDKGYTYEGAAVTALEQADVMLKALAGEELKL